jgi:hypothetical protein
MLVLRGGWMLNRFSTLRALVASGAKEQVSGSGSGDWTGLTPGFCYVDPEQGFGNEAAVASCSVSQKRLLRLLGDDVPATGAMTFIACDP